METHDDIIAIRLADGDYKNTCYACPANCEGLIRRGKTEVDCDVLNALLSGRIAVVGEKIKAVLREFKGEKPDCGPMKSAMVLGRSAAQIIGNKKMLKKSAKFI